VLMFVNGNTAIEFLFRVSPSGGRPARTWVLDSAEEPPEGGTLNEERIAVAGSSDAGPYSSSVPSSRQNIIELSYSRPH
jgi:hypothetical protein